MKKPASPTTSKPFSGRALATTLDTLQNEIRVYCEQHADPARARKYAYYFKEGYDAYGLSQEQYETQRDAYLAQHRETLGMEGFLALGERLIQTGKYEEASFALGFAAAFKAEYRLPLFERFGSWLEHGFRNWGHTDCFCSEVLAHFFLNGIADLETLAGWRTSSSKWRRRAVPVTLVKLAKQTERTSALLEFVAPMMHDEERVVHQGLGWFLREAWKANPKPVEAFLMKFRATGPRLIYQYATEKMTPEQRLRFRRDKREKA
jgi:3-methyladenine DNA glycosylase AlkD